VTGYSNTTAKHINIARSIAPYAIPLKGCKHTYSIEATISTISNQIDQLEDDINKMRPGTKKQRVAQAQQDQLRDNLKKIQHVVKVGK
jgi:outer membrane murein-binding lipoprotein Lpp